jgi:hypothetical protein
MLTEKSGSDYEQTGTGFGLTIILAGVLFLLAGFLFLAASGILTGYRPGQDVSPPASDSLKYPPLQASPAEDLRELRQTEEALLTGYGWVDQEAEVVKIPIDRAIELLAERGLPVREP